MGKLLQLIKKYPLYKVYKSEKKFAKPLSETEMCCPFCGHPLVKRGSKRLETMSEHVFDPNGTPSEKPAYYCENEECRYKDVFLWNGNRSEFDVDAGEAFFNSDKAVKEVNGERKVDDKYWELYKETSDWYTAATNTFTFKQQREETDKIYLHPIFALFLLRPYIEVYYEAKENGDIVGRKWRIHFLKKEEGREDYNIYYISSLHMFFFSMRQRKHKMKWLTKPNTTESKYYANSVKEVFGNEGYVPRSRFKREDWYRSASWTLTKILNYRTYKNVLETLKKKYIEEYGDYGGNRAYELFMKTLYE